MPRALTEQEKCRQCKRLLEKGKDAVFSQGIRKVSIDDITKTAGMAKGTFYQHFDSKEKFLHELIWNIHQQFFEQVEQMILNKGDLQANIRIFMMNLFNTPEMTFFIRNYHDINELFDSMLNQEIQYAGKMETDVYEKLLKLAGIDVKKVKPGVVHNYFHALYLMMGSDLMIKNDLPETLERMMDGLISYVFGGTQ